MGADVEERLAHDDKRRDVEDEVRGQIVEIQAVVESASSAEEHLLGLRAKEPDSRSVELSLACPVKGTGV